MRKCPLSGRTRYYLILPITIGRNYVIIFTTHNSGEITLLFLLPITRAKLVHVRFGTYRNDQLRLIPIVFLIFMIVTNNRFNSRRHMLHGKLRLSDYAMVKFGHLWWD